VKTISEQQAVQQFGEYSERAHNGERILVTRGGKPWVLLSPPVVPPEGKSDGSKLQWPDFAARLAKHYPAPVNGPTATELLAQDKEDRF
jgi:antitoxin (DNA-binding transcriptional repressor) of toxin-antitoxin stability system